MEKGTNKIQSSPFQDYAVKLLISGASWHAVSQELKRHGLDVAPDTVKNFDENFVKKVDEKTIAKFKGEIQKEKDRKEQELIDSLVYEKLNIVDALRQLINDLERHIKRMENKGAWLTWNEESVIGQYYDRLKSAKKDLAVYTSTYDFDRVRDDAINVMAEIVLDIFVPRLKEEEKRIALKEFTARIKEVRESQRLLPKLGGKVSVRARR